MQTTQRPAASEAVVQSRKRRERVKNLRQAFGVSRRWKTPKSVLIVDDIYTTGSTIHRISKVLKKAGVEKVYFLTISIGQGL